MKRYLVSFTAALALLVGSFAWASPPVEEPGWSTAHSYVSTDLGVLQEHVAVAGHEYRLPSQPAVEARAVAFDLHSGLLASSHGAYQADAVLAIPWQSSNRLIC